MTVFLKGCFLHDDQCEHNLFFTISIVPHYINFVCLEKDADIGTAIPSMNGTLVFRVYNTSMSYTDAITFCKKNNNSTLISSHDEVLDFIQSINKTSLNFSNTPKQSFWIGIRRELVWQWNDSMFITLLFLKWSTIFELLSYLVCKSDWCNRNWRIQFHRLICCCHTRSILCTSKLYLF